MILPVSGTLPVGVDVVTNVRSVPMQNPRVEVWAPAPDRSQRTTGSDTATRTDSVYDDASRREYRVVV